jgi:transcriptional regulator with XRE-family HTH domain
MPKRTGHSPASKLASNLAGAVARRRRRAGLTLEDLSRKSGISRTMLSEVERGKKSPTIRVACQIAEGLECTLSDLLGEPPAGQVTILRKRDRNRFTDPVSGVERHVLSTSLAARTVEVIWYIIPAGRATGDFPPHRPGVVEHVTVVAGELELRTGSERLLLKTGDSATYPADLSHQYRSLGRHKCEVLLLIDSSALAR